MPMDPKQIELLNRIRKEDGEDVKGDKEALNSKRLETYVRDEAHINAENFDEKFTVDIALGYLRSSPSRGEAIVLKELESAQEYMKTIGFPTLFDNENADTFKSELHKQLVKRQAEHRETDLFEVYEKYQLIRQLAEKKIRIKAKFTEERKEEMTAIGESITDQVKGTIKEVSKNFGNMTGKEKLITVGGLILATVLVYNVAKDNPTVKKITDTLWKGLKYAGIGAGAAITINYAYKLFTGKTAYTELEELTRGTTGSDGFWTETFKTSPGNAEILRNSAVYLGDKDYMDLSRRYREAKAVGSTKIEMSSVDKKDMKPEEIYTALDVFFTRYDIDTLDEKYKNDRPPIVWENVVAAELSEDGTIKIKENLWDRIKDTVDEGYTRGINYLLVGEGFGYMKEFYKKYWGVADAQDDNVREWTKELFEGNEIQKETELDSFIDRKFTPAKVQPGYKEVARRGTTDPRTGVKYFSQAGDSIYVMSRVSMASVGGDLEAAKKAFMSTEDAGTKFLKDRFPQVSDNIYKFVDMEGGVRVADTSSFILFMRMPLPGSQEFERANAGLSWRNIDQRRDIDEFKPTDKIEYAALKKWDQEALRLHFLLDSTQTTEIDNICKWFTDKFKGQGHTRKYVMEQLMKDDDLKKQAIIEQGVTQGLNASKNTLIQLEKDLAEIEDDAADDLDAAADHNHVIELMRRRKGYKVRLAVAGDTAAKASERYNPSASNAKQTLINDYENWCKTAVKKHNNGGII